MNFELIIRPEAEADIADAFDWYESRVPGLGSEFLLPEFPEDCNDEEGISL